MPLKKSEESTRFLNVDLDLRAKFGLKKLLKAFGSKIIVMNHEIEGRAYVEATKQPKSIDDAILNYFKMVKSLSSTDQSIWENCEVRRMNIGIHAGELPHEKAFSLSKKSIERLHMLNAEVVFTVYANQKS